jgi:DNA replication and repair protein RecF
MPARPLPALVPGAAYGRRVCGPYNGPVPQPPTRALLTRLRLAGYRNYAALALDLEPRSVVLVGPNGAGKTNLLEAISFLSPGRGLRGARLDEVARQGGDGAWAVAATVVNGSGGVEIGTGIAMTLDGPESRRSVRVDHVPVRSAEALLDHVRVVWLTPAMDGLFVAPASERRRFLDRAVASVDKAHGTRVNAFERAMRGRNRLLAEGTESGGFIDAVEAEMAELAVAIAAARREWAALIAPLIAENAAASPFPAAEIALEGTIEHALDGHPAAVVEDDYRAELGGERPRDMQAGRTLSGPHTSDLRVRHGPKQAAAETCSTGEQKALLIGLVLAGARLWTRLSGETPLVLLDEVAAHLDAARRQALFAVLADLGCQAFLTGTDLEPFGTLRGSAEILAVADGTVRRVAV